MNVDPDGATWRKSTYSNGTGGNCVEVADLHSGRAVRDSKHPEGPILVFDQGRVASVRPVHGITMPRAHFRPDQPSHAVGVLRGIKAVRHLRLCDRAEDSRSRRDIGSHHRPAARDGATPAGTAPRPTRRAVRQGRHIKPSRGGLTSRVALVGRPRSLGAESGRLSASAVTSAPCQRRASPIRSFAAAPGPGPGAPRRQGQVAHASSLQEAGRAGRRPGGRPHHGQDRNRARTWPVPTSWQELYTLNLQATHNNVCVDVPFATNDQFAALWMWNCHATASDGISQRWTFFPAGASNNLGPTYRIANQGRLQLVPWPGRAHDS